MKQSQRNASSKPTPAKLWVGFGRGCITPDFPVPLAGYGNSAARMSQGAWGPSYAICTALRDEAGSTVLLVVTDLAGMAETIARALRQAITAATGVPGDRIMISGIHTHSGPDLNIDHPSVTQYMPFFTGQVVNACADAVADLSPATLQAGAVEVEGMNFVRHYRMIDGTYAGDNFGNKTIPYASHEREPDRQMQVLRFCRQDKQDILLLSWQAHPKIASTIATEEGRKTRGLMTADYVGFLREYVAAQTGCQVGFYQGSAGNLNALSNIPQERASVPLDAKVYGEQLGQWVLKALEHMTPRQTGPVRIKQVFSHVRRDHTEDHLVEQAREVFALWQQTNDYNLCAEKGAPYGIVNAYHAGSIISRSKSSDSKEIELNAIAIGDVAFVTAPYEMFCQNGQAIKAGSPFENTVIIAHCNGSNAYIAADAAFEFNSYEVQNRLFVRGTAEQLQDQLVHMLQELK